MNHTRLSDFHLSFVKNDTEKMVKLILESNVDVLNSTIKELNPSEHFFGFTALHISVEKNNLEVVKLLLNHGADINAMSTDGTPLVIVIAMVMNHRSMFDFLMSKGANVKILTLDENENIYHLYFQLFDNAGTNVTKANYYIRRLFEAGCDINHQNSKGETPLCYAPVLSFKCMFQYGANINIKDKDGKVPLIANYIFNSEHLRDYKFYADAYIEIEKCKLTKILFSHDNNALYNLSADKMSTLDPCQIYFTSTNIMSLRQNYLRELDQFKEIKIDCRKTLYNLLLMDIDDMKFCCKKENVKIINSFNSMKNKYPLFGSIVKYKINVCQERMALFDLATQALNNILSKDYVICIACKKFYVYVQMKI